LLVKMSGSGVNPVTGNGVPAGTGVPDRARATVLAGKVTELRNRPVSNAVNKPEGRAQQASNGRPRDQFSFLLIPVSDAGKKFGEQASEVFPELQIVNVPGQADLMFCREQTNLGLEDLERILRSCRDAYREFSTLPQLSPHARFDIQDWTPLDP
jgi:hypothetical protein